MDSFAGDIARVHESALRSIARVVTETTEPTPPSVALTLIAEQLRSGRVLVVTGAGVSTDSGIPDYRGPRGSLSRHRPMTYQEFRHSPPSLKRYWARSYVGWRQMNRARPNFTHYALVELEQVGCVSGIVTQNVDGLHMEAGSQRVVGLHGDLAKVACLNCGYVEARESLDRRLADANPGYLERAQVGAGDVNPDGDVYLPDSLVAEFQLVGCVACGSKLLKPDVVYFGEPVPEQRKRAVRSLLDESDSVLVAGSSLAVMSGYRIILDALKAGKQVSVINAGPGRADPKVQVLWREHVRPAFAVLLDEVGI